jgi:phage-related protein
MPKTKVVLYQKENGSVPLVDWLKALERKAYLKCRARLGRLAELGHELRRPEADFLRDGVYELRASYQGINYRILYFFHKDEAVVVSHGLVKERKVPDKEIDLAIRRKNKFEANPALHTFEKEL